MIAATLHGPSYSPPNYDFDTIEVFDTLEDVIDALFDRHSSNGQRQCDAAYLDGHTDSVLYPTFGDGMSFTCYLVPQEAGTTGLTEVMVMDAHCAVHGGWKDYTVTLVEGVVDGMIVTVRKAGI